MFIYSFQLLMSNIWQRNITSTFWPVEGLICVVSLREILTMLLKLSMILFAILLPNYKFLEPLGSIKLF